jgi:hypothetical protein
MELSIKDFWPKPEHCDECLITEAETADVAVFLAVHQPIRLYRRRLSVQAEVEEKNETDLLEALLAQNLPSGTLLVPIVGNSGVGKSHMIRWLDAQLRNRDDGVPRHIVRIPKSSSMRRVLELILENLPENHYGPLRKELTSARMPLDLQRATHRLRENLLVGIERAYREAQARRLEGKERADDRERMAHCHQQGLPTLLQDPEISAHFMAYEGTSKGVLARIAERYIQGAHVSGGPTNQFSENDLILDEKLDRTTLARSTLQYLISLNLREGQALKVAVRLLNDLIDNALGELLDFGGNSLSDVFVKLREQLLNDGKELVLLVEDFAALAGIQGSLLDAMIREGIRDGGQQLCVMRTALAVTEGYLANRETVLTRAQYEWRIEERPFGNDEEAIDTFTNFVGGYLNAARWGKTRLAQEFKKRRRDDVDLQHWVPNFYDRIQDDIKTETRAALEVFGFSSRGKHPLFPFNRGAIHQLARRHLRKGTTFALNPRELINVILRETLLLNRPLFDADEFPPGDFQQFARRQLALPVARELTQRADPWQVDRLAALIYHWGDDPQSPAEAACLQASIYDTFRLPVLQWSEAPEKSSRPVKEQTAVNESEKRRDERRDPWIQKLQQWREHGVISQADANKVRQLLRDAVAEWIDWEALLIKALPLDHGGIALPKASTGNPNQANTLAVAATDEDWRDETKAGQFYGALSAVIRFHTGSRSWNYDGGEADSAAYANLISRMAKQAENCLRGRSHSLTREAVRPLVQALLIDARLLGMAGATANSDADNMAAIFADAPEDDGTTLDAGDHWSKLRSSARLCRAEMKELLLRLVAARQGGGDTVQAVDAAELLEAVRDLRKSWQLPADVNLKLFEDHRRLLEHIRELKNLLKNAVEQRRVALCRWRNEIEKWVGTDFDVRAIVDEMNKTALAAHQSHVFRCPDLLYDSLRDSVNKLQNCRLKETLDFAQKAVDAQDFGVVLSALAQSDLRTEETSRRIFGQYEQFLRHTAEEVAERLAKAPPSINEEGLHRAQEVESIEKLWREIGVTE